MRLVGIVAAAALAGCGGGSAGTRVASTPPPIGAISVRRALESRTDEALLVRGFLVLDGDHARLCGALAESHPPQCGGPSLEIEGLPAGDRSGLQEADGVAWSQHEVALFGTVADGVLRAGQTPR